MVTKTCLYLCLTSSCTRIYWSYSQWHCKLRLTFMGPCIINIFQYTEWPKKMYTHFIYQYLWNKLWQCLDADGGHFEHLHWIQNSRTSLISILLLYKYSSYDYRVIFFMSKCVYIILGHSLYPKRCSVTQFIYIWKLLYIFRVVPRPIIRNAYICI
jgi:hypothetical protein